MMCPSCKVQLRIAHSGVVVEDGVAVTVQELRCGNPRCPYHRAGLPVRRIRHVHAPAPAADEALRMHCDMTLARIDGTGYFVAPGLEHTVRDGVLSVRCPVCGEWQRYDVAGLAALT